MDSIRRGAMVKMGQRAVGALGAAGLIGRGNIASAQLDTARPTRPPDAPYPPSAGYAGNETLAKERSSPLQVARYKAAEPINQRIRDLRGYDRPQLRHHWDELDHLRALRSTSEYWRAGVRMDRAKKLQGAIDQLENQIRSILADPLEKLDETFREAVTAFLTELQKP